MSSFKLYNYSFQGPKYQSLEKFLNQDVRTSIVIISQDATHESM
jgi:hypothetical protein